MGVAGRRTPEGFLTRYEGTIIELLLRRLEKEPGQVTTGAGLLILRANDEMATFLPKALDQFIAAARRDGEPHDFSFIFQAELSGLTIHCNFRDHAHAEALLADHCQRRKYKEHVDAWYGLSLNPLDGSIRFGAAVKGAWSKDSDMEARTSQMREGVRIGPKAMVKPHKSGRNAPCACGSGRKYKKCCGA